MSSAHHGQAHPAGLEDALGAIAWLVDADRQIDGTDGQDAQQRGNLLGGFGAHHRDGVPGGDAGRTQRGRHGQRLVA